MIINNKIAGLVAGGATGLIEAAASTRCSGAGCAACLCCLTAGTVVVLAALSHTFNTKTSTKEDSHGLAEIGN